MCSAPRPRTGAEAIEHVSTAARQCLPVKTGTSPRNPPAGEFQVRTVTVLVIAGAVCTQTSCGIALIAAAFACTTDCAWLPPRQCYCHAAALLLRLDVTCNCTCLPTNRLLSPFAACCNIQLFMVTRMYGMPRSHTWHQLSTVCRHEASITIPTWLDSSIGVCARLVRTVANQ